MVTYERTQYVKYIEEKTNELFNELRSSLLCGGKTIYLTALGGSMYPFIKSGDKIKIEPINNRRIKIGDITAVDIKTDESSRFFVHRIVKITGDGENSIYFTKGDAYNGKDLDRPVAIESIIGRVTWIKRKDLNIDLETPLWRHFSNLVGKLSFKYPGIIPFFSIYINMVLERKSFLAKVKSRLKKWNPVFYNAEELLLICARKDLSEKLKNKAIDLIKEGIDWDGFCDYAIRAGVTILISKSIEEILRYTHIPKYVIDKLRAASIFIMSRSAYEHRKITNILELFASRDIPTVPLKGIILSKRLYGDIAARGLSVDLDLLIEEKNKERARELLERNGYLFSCGEISRLQWQYDFIKNGQVRIDLHWDITMMLRSQRRIDGLWNGTRLVKECGVSYYEFKEEELLLSLSAHLVNSSALRSLRHICDIHEFLRRYKNIIDWEIVVKKAKEWRLSSSLYTALTMSKKLFDSPVSCEILDKIKPRWPKRMFIRCFANRKFILRDCKRKKFMDRFLSYIFFELVEAESFCEYYNIAFRRLLFPPRDAMLSSRNYTSKPAYLGYPIRLTKGLITVIRTFL